MILPRVPSAKNHIGNGVGYRDWNLREPYRSACGLRQRAVASPGQADGPGGGHVGARLGRRVRAGGERVGTEGPAAAPDLRELAPPFRVDVTDCEALNS